MKINIFGSTGIIGTKSLFLIEKYFPKIKINLLCANNNSSKIIRQSFRYSPKYIYLNNEKKFHYLKKNINPKTKILNLDEMKAYLRESKSDFFSIYVYLVVLIFNLFTKSFSANLC